jgi:hypothetical protein
VRILRGQAHSAVMRLFSLRIAVIPSVVRYPPRRWGALSSRERYPREGWVMATSSRSLRANWRTVLFGLVLVSLACAPVSWVDDGLTPSWIVYPLILSVGLWRMWRGHGTLYFGIAGTIFLLVHLPFTWAALFGSHSPSGADKPYNPVQWLITLFIVPLLTVIAGFLGWQEARQARSNRSELSPTT